MTDKKQVADCKHYNSSGTCKWLSALFRVEVKEHGRVLEKKCLAMQDIDCPILDLEEKNAELEMRLEILEGG